MAASTRLPTKAPSGPPSQTGKRSSSSHVTLVARRRRAGRSENRPVPVTSPTWRTPMARPGRHSVTSMRSTSRMGPTLVSQAKVVPTPERRSDVNRIASASAIHSTCDGMSRRTSQTAPGRAATTLLTRIFATGGNLRPGW